mgnify:CR=1 FL=1
MACRKVIRTKARARQGACLSSSRALRSLPASLLAAGSRVGFRQATEDAAPAEEPNARDETRPKRTFPTDEQRAEQRRAVEAWRRDKEALAKYEEGFAIGRTIEDRGMRQMVEGAALGGLGIAILSTSSGLLTNQQAAKKGVGGEVLAYVW